MKSNFYSEFVTSGQQVLARVYSRRAALGVLVEQTFTGPAATAEAMAWAQAECAQREQVLLGFLRGEA